MTSKAPIFRQIAPLPEVDDTALENAMQKLRVPTMQPTDNKTNARPEKSITDEGRAEEPKHPSQTMNAAPTVKKTPAASINGPAPTVKVTFDLPEYLNDELKLEALKRRSSGKHLIMLGLKAIGFKIKDIDMVQDGRRSGRRLR